jgi:hypothetical protein
MNYLLQQSKPKVDL